MFLLISIKKTNALLFTNVNNTMCFDCYERELQPISPTILNENILNLSFFEKISYIWFHQIFSTNVEIFSKSNKLRIFS